MIPTILIIEDEPTLARNLCVFLERSGFHVEIANGSEVGLYLCEQLKPQVVLLDYHLPGADGLTILGKIQARSARTDVIMLASHGSASTAVNALKAGAADYLIKPMEPSAMLLVIERVLQKQSVKVIEPNCQGGDVVPFQHAGVAALIGDSAPMQALRKVLSRIIDSDKLVGGADLPGVLITGETGTGKELVARALHFDGPRRSGPFIEINCAGIPAKMLETELFGHERGAFTDAKQTKLGLIEAANGGTLLLDEIGDLDLTAQAKLLKVIEERQVRRLGSIQDPPLNVRFLAATSVDLEERVREGRFRADLYYRLRVIRVKAPALRERGRDIAQLGEHFLNTMRGRYGKPNLKLSNDAVSALMRHGWEGNVRELRNTIEQAIILTETDVIGGCDLGLCALNVNTECTAREGRPFETMKLQDVERTLLATALEKSDANLSAAARRLGISRDTLRYRVKKFGISH